MKTSSNDLQRYDDNTRMNHWALALLFFCAGLSGLAFFHPSLYFFTGLFGGGTWTRILHPYFGVLMFLSFLGIYARLAKDNAWKASDREWLDKSGEMFKGNKDSMPPVGKYNAGQKIIFWVMTVSLVVLLVTGILSPQALDAFSQAGWSVRERVDPRAAEVDQGRAQTAPLR